MTRPHPRIKSESTERSEDVSLKSRLRFTTRQWFLLTAAICLFCAIPVSIHLFLTMSGWLIIGIAVVAVPLLLQLGVYLMLRPLNPPDPQAGKD